MLAASLNCTQLLRLLVIQGTGQFHEQDTREPDNCIQGCSHFMGNPMSECFKLVSCRCQLSCTLYDTPLQVLIQFANLLVVIHCQNVRHGISPLSH